MNRARGSYILERVRINGRIRGVRLGGGFFAVRANVGKSRMQEKSAYRTRPDPEVLLLHKLDIFIHAFVS